MKKRIAQLVVAGSLVIPLTGCLEALFFKSAGKALSMRKVNIYPKTADWEKLQGGATKLGWKAERGDEKGWALTVVSSAGKKMEMMEAENICSIAADQQLGTGCRGLSYSCEDLGKKDCDAQLVSLVKSAGYDVGTLKLSNHMANTEATGEPIAP